LNLLEEKLAMVAFNSMIENLEYGRSIESISTCYMNDKFLDVKPFVNALSQTKLIMLLVIFLINYKPKHNKLILWSLFQSYMKLPIRKHMDCCHPQKCIEYNLCLLHPQGVSFEKNHPLGHMDASKL
jgi:hypothetical protein